MRLLLMTLTLVYVAMAADDKAGSLLKRLVNLLEEQRGQTMIRLITDCDKLCKDIEPRCMKYKNDGVCDTRIAPTFCMATCFPEKCPGSCKSKRDIIPTDVNKKSVDLYCDKMCKDLYTTMCGHIKTSDGCSEKYADECVGSCFPDRCPRWCKSKRDIIPTDVNKQFVDPDCECKDVDPARCGAIKRNGNCNAKYAADCLASCPQWCQRPFWC